MFKKPNTVPTPDDYAELRRIIDRQERLDKTALLLHKVAALLSNHYKPGEPCPHPGCLSHITHPCKGCGRIGGQL